MAVTVLFSTHSHYLDHLTGANHPERPARLQAVWRGAKHAGLGDELVLIEPRPASRQDIERVHSPTFVDTLEQFCRAGGGHLDADTTAGEDSFSAAVLAAGAGLGAIDRLERGEGDAAFLAVRPPGHHATPDRAMGFCLFNNIAVAAASLAARGERVLVVDYDAHHGNGTQTMFWEDPNVVYASLHQYPLYPGTGWLDDVGEGDGRGTTVNFPFPPGTTGEHYLAAVDEVLAPLNESFESTWLLLSVGFDGHRSDPLTSLGLTAGDYAELTARLVALGPRRKCVAFLEGGYDLDALTQSTTACLTALAGAPERPEPPSQGGPGADIVRTVRDLRASLGDGWLSNRRPS